MCKIFFFNIYFIEEVPFFSSLDFSKLELLKFRIENFCNMALGIFEIANLKFLKYDTYTCWNLKFQTIGICNLEFRMLEIWNLQFKVVAFRMVFSLEKLS